MTTGAISPAELSIVCARYDLGEIRATREMRLGAGASAKARLDTSRGSFVVKRWPDPDPAGPATPARVAFVHSVHIHLARRKYPVPRLLGTIRENNSMVEHAGHVYEVVEFAHGERFDSSPAQAERAGRALAYFHRFLGDFRSEWEAPRGTYHAPARRTPEGSTPFAGEFEAAASIDPAGARLRDRYTQSWGGSREVARWPEQVIHADWHPGNVLFVPRADVAAVLDLEAVRAAPRVVDLANALLQFSIESGPDSWSPEVDLARFESLARGYESVEGCRISSGEIEAIPSLMVEALIVEAVVPIARSGRFGSREPGPILRGVEAACERIVARSGRFREVLASRGART